ncbi:MAG: c-type cytochrome biogenesis protein CcmI [Amphritea sp.]|nr:c-type cytochrome biogenesis protein CcmI [Amphritea sp.]
MTELWLGIALLSVLATAFVLYPLYKARTSQAVIAEDVDRRALNIDIFQERLAELDDEFSAGNLDQENYDALKLELERNLLQDVDDSIESAKETVSVTRQMIVTALLLAILVPSVGLVLYQQYGRADDLSLALNQPADPFNGQQPTLEQAVTELQSRLGNDPENPEGWYLLANTYMGMQRYQDAAESYAKTLKYLPQDAPQYAGVNGQYAQALFFANQGQMNEQIRAEVDKTLSLEPFEITALGLLGIEAYESERYEDAIGFWRKALQNASAEQADSLKSGLRSAREKLIAAGVSVPDMPELESVKLRLAVSIKPELMDRVKPDQPVFVFARPVGGRMPLAAVKLTVADLPTEVVLDDSLAMQPELRLSMAETVEVAARISTSGELRAAAGDLSGILPSVVLNEQTDILDLTIDKIEQ